MTTTLRNFSILGVVGVTLTAGVLTARVKLRAAGQDIMLYNKGATIIRVRTGDSTVEADAASMPILPGQMAVYNRGPGVDNVTHLAYISDSAAPAFEMFVGEGL